MNLKTLTKKITSFLAVGAVGLSVIFSSAPAQAFSIGDAINIGGALIQGSATKRAAQKEIDRYNNTDEGRQELYQYFRENKGVNTDAQINARLDSIMAKLSAAVAEVDPSIEEKPYLYFVSADETLNAACSMGHIMMVNVGTFRIVPTDDQIAAIVGHEMGHGQRDHTATSIKKKLNKQMLASVAASAAGGGTLASAVGSIALTHSVASGDRKLEWEADNMSWEYMLNTDYNLGAGAAVMQRFVELIGGKSHSNFLNPSDHPDSDKRRDNYVDKLYEYSNKHVTAKDGIVIVNEKTFTTVAATSSMSSAERSYFVLGNLARAYHNGEQYSEARVVDGAVYLGNQNIMTPVEGDEDAYTLAEKLNSIK